MTLLRCQWGECNSDGRHRDKPHMKGVKFFTFPKPQVGNPMHPKTIQCRQWIAACGRPKSQLNIEKIQIDVAKRNYYHKVCSKVSSFYYFITQYKGHAHAHIISISVHFYSL